MTNLSHFNCLSDVMSPKHHGWRTSHFKECKISSRADLKLITTHSRTCFLYFVDLWFTCIHGVKLKKSVSKRSAKFPEAFGNLWQLLIKTLIMNRTSGGIWRRYCCIYHYVTALGRFVCLCVGEQRQRHHLKAVFNAPNPIKQSWEGLLLICRIGD